MNAEMIKNKTPSEMRDRIVALESVMREMPGQQIDIPLTHHFAPGVYMREIFIPKGSTVVGKIHKTEHLSVLIRGEISVLTEDGIKRMTASQVVLARPGMKRVIFAHEDSVWITVHPNQDNGIDVDKIEERLIAKSFDELLGGHETPAIESQGGEP